MADLKTLKTKLRRSGLVELALSRLRRADHVAFPEIATDVPLKQGDIAIDCGANIGDITSRLARTGATVHAFEPNPICFAILQKRFRGFSNVHLHQKGVMDRDTVLTLRTPRAHAGFDAVATTVAASFVDGVQKGEDYDVDETVIPCIDFAAFVDGLPKKVALLKMDVEGSEIPVINAMLDRGTFDRIEMTLVETHEALSPKLAEDTAALRRRIDAAGIADKVNLDWI